MPDYWPQALPTSSTISGHAKFGFGTEQRCPFLPSAGWKQAQLAGPRVRPWGAGCTSAGQTSLPAPVAFARQLTQMFRNHTSTFWQMLSDGRLCPLC